MSDVEPLLRTLPSDERKTAAIYIRVSTHKQADAGNLERQRVRILEYAAKNGYHVLLEAADTASGMNTHRRGLRKVVEAAKRSEFRFLLIEYPDQLARFGYEYLRELFAVLNVTIIATVVATTEDEDAHSELVKDHLAIVASFSARLYGARGGRKVREKVSEALTSLEV